MNWKVLASLISVVIGMILYEWPKLNKNQKKEKAAFLTLTAIGCFLAILIIFFPSLPGPTQLVEAMFKPLGKLLE
jgi:hypothetical protein